MSGTLLKRNDNQAAAVQNLVHLLDDGSFKAKLDLLSLKETQSELANSKPRWAVDSLIAIPDVGIFAIGITPDGSKKKTGLNKDGPRKSLVSRFKGGNNYWLRGYEGILALAICANHFEARRMEVMLHEAFKNHDKWDRSISAAEGRKPPSVNAPVVVYIVYGPEKLHDDQ